MMQMIAKGAEYITGTFTVPLSDSSYEVQYGKSFNSYLLLIEMSDASKTELINSGVSNHTVIRYCVMYPAVVIGNVTHVYVGTGLTYRPSSGDTSSASLGAAALSSSSFVIDTRDVQSSGNIRLIRGYTYKYTIVSLDNVQ